MNTNPIAAALDGDTRPLERFLARVAYDEYGKSFTWFARTVRDGRDGFLRDVVTTLKALASLVHGEDRWYRVYPEYRLAGDGGRLCYITLVILEVDACEEVQRGMVIETAFASFNEFSCAEYKMPRFSHWRLSPDRTREGNEDTAIEWMQKWKEIKATTDDLRDVKVYIPHKRMQTTFGDFYYAKAVDNARRSARRLQHTLGVPITSLVVYRIVDKVFVEPVDIPLPAPSEEAVRACTIDAVQASHASSIIEMIDV